MSAEHPDLPHRLITLIRRDASSGIALRTPDGPPLTFAGLSRQVDYVGSVLRRVGISATDRVAVRLPDGPTMASSFLGIASFATCAPLNPSLGREELEGCFHDVRVAAVVLPADADALAREVARERQHSGAGC